ncbi:NHL repeat-containing protein [Cohnella thailandensis]|uniref:NHL repeat-containing protein n=1 Tax=Cohnella thailandensis TaxID=557557 RepID=A0A841T486_9BACL|nr:NHL repeat-containing protein [Cohnella thailandensis]MBB6637809.1 NHL repeat-containing protein [Cohnella thailandensis]MBP1974011.1 DNA-binding beta-propeller fold protein YncE [Cohnella thailandensis]
MRTTKWIRAIAAATALSSFLLMFSGYARASVPYVGYTYDGWGDRVWSPAAYVPDRVVEGEKLGIGSFNQPEDIHVTEAGQIYVADTGNNRIVELNGRYEFVRQLDKFVYEGSERTFNKPRGVFVTEQGEIYVADTGNHQVVRLRENGEADLVIAAPKSEYFAGDFVFDPKKIAVDTAGRILVIADRVFDGIMEFGENGEFQNFFAANRVTYNVADYVWKRYFSTDAQKERMVTFVPTEYTNLDLDGKDFVFTTSAERTLTPIKRHNPSGTDVLLRQGFFNPIGDVKYDTRGQSTLVDISVGPDGTYSVLDSIRGRIFTYDSEGKLLYVFGSIGDRVGNFKVPSAIDQKGDSILVLDRELARLTTFAATDYGKLINEAVHNHYIGNENRAAELWKEVLTLNENLEIAYSGISKANFREGNHEKAVKEAKFALDRDSYSKAYKHLRKETLKEHFNTILTTIFALALAWAAWKLFRKFRRRKGGASHVERTP